MKGYMYILLCANGQCYTGSTNDLNRRLAEHQNGEGANFTKKHLPVELVYFEEFQRIDEAFYREKQVQGWSRRKKEAMINSEHYKLHDLSECKNETHFRNAPFDFLSASLKEQSQGTGDPVVERNENPVVEWSQNPVVERMQNPLVARNKNP